MMRAIGVMVFVVLLFGPGGGLPGLAAGCLKNETSVRLETAAPVSMRDYLCRTPGSRPAQFKVQFLRLNSMAMSALIARRSTPSLAAVVSDARLFENPVLAEFKLLLDRFGVDDALSESAVTFASPTGDNVGWELPPFGERQEKKTQTVRVLIASEADGANVDYPDPTAVLALERARQMPSNYTRSGSGELWRYMSRADLDGYEASMRAFNRVVTPAFQKYYPFHENHINYVGHHIGLLRHVGRAHWPDRFVVIVGHDTTGGCADGGWQFQFYPRTPIVDVAVVHNTSNRALRIDELIGAESRDERLRPQNHSRRLRKRRGAVVAAPGVTVAPGERLVVATRIVFAVSDALNDRVREFSGARPEMVNYAYGPEIALTGLTVDGGRIEFDGHSANFLALSTSCECGSCPYVHAWDETERRWRNKGKIIHTARGADAETSETITLDGLVTRFRIVEEEAEAAFINRVALTLELDDGQRLTVVPEAAELLAKDDRYARLLFGQAMEIRFTAPRDLGGARVARSHFTLGGYYRRYSEIIAEAVSRERLTLLPQLD